MKILIIMLLLTISANRDCNPTSIASDYAFAEQLSSEVNTEFIMRKISIGELLNKKFNRLTIIEEVSPKIYGRITQRRVKCICDCGTEKEIPLSSVNNGDTKSCGCLIKESATKHGKANSRLYHIWESMKQRCINPQNCNYRHYGIRGIKICDEWANNSKAFFDWAMATGYKEDLTIDRKDNNGNYEPSNCRWITSKENSRNRSTTKLSMREAIEIRNLYSSGHTTQTELAGIYNVSIGNVIHIIKNETWM